jgi:hypothetical protein
MVRRIPADHPSIADKRERLGEFLSNWGAGGQVSFEASIVRRHSPNGRACKTSYCGRERCDDFNLGRGGGDTCRPRHRLFRLGATTLRLVGSPYGGPCLARYLRSRQVFSKRWNIDFCCRSEAGGP